MTRSSISRVGSRYLKSTSLAKANFVYAKRLISRNTCARKVQHLLSKSHESFDLSVVRSPFAFMHLFERCQSNLPELKLVNLHPLAYRQFAKGFWNRLIKEKLVSMF